VRREGPTRVIQPNNLHREGREWSTHRSGHAGRRGTSSVTVVWQGASARAAPSRSGTTLASARRDAVAARAAQRPTRRRHRGGWSLALPPSTVRARPIRILDRPPVAVGPGDGRNASPPCYRGTAAESPRPPPIMARRDARPPPLRATAGVDSGAVSTGGLSCRRPSTARCSTRRGPEAWHGHLP